MSAELADIMSNVTQINDTLYSIQTLSQSITSLNDLFTQVSVIHASTVSEDPRKKKAKEAVKLITARLFKILFSSSYRCIDLCRKSLATRLVNVVNFA